MKNAKCGGVLGGVTFHPKPRLHATRSRTRSLRCDEPPQTQAPRHQVKDAVLVGGVTWLAECWRRLKPELQLGGATCRLKPRLHASRSRTQSLFVVPALAESARTRTDFCLKAGLRTKRQEPHSAVRRATSNTGSTPSGQGRSPC